MAAKAQIIDFLLAGYRNPTTDLPLNAGTITVTDAGTSNTAYVWDDRDKTLPTTTGRSTITLDASGQAEVYGDGVYKFVIKDSLGSTVETIDYAEYLSILEYSQYTKTTLGSLPVIDDDSVYMAGRDTVGDGGEGHFTGITTASLSSADLAFIATDPQEGIYIAGSGGYWKRSYSGAVSVLWFGPNTTPGTTDMHAAGQAALNTLLAGGELVFPKETYKTTAIITATVTGPLLVNGDSSILLCDAGGIKVTQSTAREQVEVKDLTFHANGAAVGIALELEFTSLVSQTERSAKVVNVDVLTPTAQIATSYFTYGIKLTNAWNYLIDKCYVRGSGNNTTNMIGNYWLDGQCTDGTMTASHGYFATYGFYAPLTSESEGTKVIGCYFIYVDYGVYMTPTLKQPSFFMSDIHISSLVQCLHIERMDQMNWNNMLLYIRGEVVGLWTAVYLEDCSNNNFNNIVQGGSNAVATKTGFEVISSDRNHFTNITLTGVHGKFVETGSAANVYDGISVQVDGDATRPYLESDNIGKSYFNSWQTIGTELETSATIAVADSVALADVVFDGLTDHSVTGITFDSGDFTNLTNPDGVDRFIITVYVQWVANNTGVRQVALFEDGLLIQSVSVVANNESECLIVTKPINAVIGTVYKIKARQTSGAPLNIDVQSYFDITAV